MLTFLRTLASPCIVSFGKGRGSVCVGFIVGVLLSLLCLNFSQLCAGLCWSFLSSYTLLSCSRTFPLGSACIEHQVHALRKTWTWTQAMHLHPMAAAAHDIRDPQIAQLHRRRRGTTTTRYVVSQTHPLSVGRNHRSHGSSHPRVDLQRQGS